MNQIQQILKYAGSSSNCSVFLANHGFENLPGHGWTKPGWVVVLDSDDTKFYVTAWTSPRA